MVFASISCFLLLVVGAMIPDLVTSAAITNDNSFVHALPATAALTVLVSVALIASIVVFFVVCTDCYNAEVDTSSHPACGKGSGTSGAAMYPSSVTTDHNYGQPIASQQSYASAPSAPIMMNYPAVPPGFQDQNRNHPGVAANTQPEAPPSYHDSLLNRT